MDNLVLIRVSAALGQSLARSVLRDVHQEDGHRFRLVFDRKGRPASVVISLDPSGPWIGRTVAGRVAPRRSPGPFAALCRRHLRHSVLDGVVKGSDRSVTLGFADGSRLVAALVPHAANLVLLDGEGRVRACGRRPRAARAGFVAGERYRPPELPGDRLDPVTATASDIDRRVERELRTGTDLPQALRRAIFGVSAVSARMVRAESGDTGLSPGQVLARRVVSLLEGRADPVLEGPEDMLQDLRRAAPDPEDWCLLPWEPPGPPDPPRQRLRLEDAALTAGFYHWAREAHRESGIRARALRRILDAEIARGHRAESHIATDLKTFEDPDRYRLQAEALLAGLRDARRIGDHVLVPDPYDASGRTLSVPVSGGETLQQAAESLFARHRRARRGLEQARNRAERVASRLKRLEEIRARFPNPVDPASAVELAQAMRRERIAVGLERPPGRRTPIAGSRPRLEGVRLFEGAGGASILVGKGGKENDRLTFKLAGPEDFWFHALGVPGAHVVVRNERREPRPPRELLGQAAAVAAWYSEARRQPHVEVQWTRRKYVRRLKGAAPGNVKVKKSETVRVRPALPAGGDEGA